MDVGMLHYSYILILFFLYVLVFSKKIDVELALLNNYLFAQAVE